MKANNWRNRHYFGPCFFCIQHPTLTQLYRCLRVDADRSTDVDILSQLKMRMKQSWQLPDPSIVISVTGGAQNFRKKTRLLRSFKRGLMKAATAAPGCWLCRYFLNIIPKWILKVPGHFFICHSAFNLRSFNYCMLSSIGYCSNSVFFQFSNYLSVCLYVCMSVCLSIYLSVYLSVWLSVCLSVFILSIVIDIW